MGDDLLAEQLRTRGIDDERVLAAIASLDRADFVGPEVARMAGEDSPLPIGWGQTISQPFIVAYMTQVLAPEEGERFLELGTGSGYQAAVLARLGVEVYSTEIVPELARSAQERLSRLGLLGRIHLREGDGSAGWPDAAPFDGIVLTAAPERLPETLLWQLRPGGRLVAPIGAQDEAQTLIRVRKDAAGQATVERLMDVRFVPVTHRDQPPA